MGKSKLSIRYSFAVIPVVIALAVAVMGLLANVLISSSRSAVESRSEECARLLEARVSQITGKLEIYRETIDRFYQEDEEALYEYLKSTYGKTEMCPQGIYIGGDDNFFLSADEWVPEEGYDVTSRPWYDQARYSKDYVFGEPYVDMTLNKVCISVSVRMDYEKSVRVMATDIYDDYAQTIVDELAKEGNLDDAIIVTGTGINIVADSNGTQAGTALADSGRGIYSRISEIIASGKEGAYVISDGGTTHNLDVKYISTANWYLVTCVHDRTLWHPVNKMIPVITLAVAIAVAALIAYAWRYSRHAVLTETHAQTDRLTGVYNRETFQRIVSEKKDADRYGGMLVLFDLDHFKQINDQLGHPEGDRVLSDFAALLKDFFDRSTNFSGRLGGDEFAVFIDSRINSRTAGAMLERFMKRARELFKEYEKYGLSVSAGAAYGQDYDSLYKNADRYLYQAKQEGRNRYCVEGLETHLSETVKADGDAKSAEL